MVRVLGRPLTGVLAVAVVAGCLTVPPAAGQEAGSRVPPTAKGDTDVVVSAIDPGFPYEGLVPAAAAARTPVEWPAGQADAVLGGDPVEVAGLPVQVGPASGWALGGQDPAPGSVSVRVWDRSDTLAAGVNGLILVIEDTTTATEPTTEPSGGPTPSPAPLARLTPTPDPSAEPAADPSPSSSPTPSVEPSASAAPSPEPSSNPEPSPSESPEPEPGVVGGVGVRVDYRGFGDAYGGGWGSRLGASALPACTPGQEDSCGPGEALRFVNDPDSGALSVLLPADRAVELPGGRTGWVVALDSAVNGRDGNWGASPLAASATWTAGTSAGSLLENYPIQAPPASAGPSPDLGLSYTSEAVDGQTSATNNQSAAAGVGWTLEPGFIERRYQPCWQATAPDAEPGRADLCWAGDNAVAAGGPGAGELVPVAGQTGDPVLWRAQLDDGSKIERIDPAGSETERWVVTAVDGTRFFYGAETGDAAGDPARWRVPVVRDPVGAPQAYTDMVWRWNLVKAIDAWGNTTTYTWAKHNNQYQANGSVPGGPHSLKTYDAGGRLLQVAYPGGWADLRWGTRCWNGTGFVENPATGSGCDLTAQPPETDQGDWLPDVPTDELCPLGDPDLDADRCGASPVFYSDHRLARILTGAGTPPAPGTGPDAAAPDSATDDYSFGQTITTASGPPNNTGVMGFLWLGSVTRTGRSTDTPVSLPATVYTPTWLPNLAAGAPEEGIDNANTRFRPRLEWTAAGTGQQRTVTYAPGDCTQPAVADPPGTAFDPGTGNTQRCYPVREWNTLGAKWQWWWWHKPIVASVSTVDTTWNATGSAAVGTAATTTTYTSTGPAWAFDDSPLTLAPDRASAQWRGHQRVDTRVGTGDGSDLTSSAIYFQGMPGGTITGAPDGQLFADAWWRQGQQLDQITWSSAGATAVSSSRTVADCHPVVGADPCSSTGGGTGRAVSVGAGSTGTTTWNQVGTAAAGTATTTTTSTDVTTGGSPAGPVWLATGGTVQLDGTLLRSTAITYSAGDSGRWLWARPTRALTTGTGGQALADQTIGYDNGSPAPTSTTALSGSGDSYDVATETRYDGQGRPEQVTTTGAGSTGTTYTEAGGRLVRTTVTDAAGHVTATDLDRRGSPIRVTDPNGITTDGHYDALGRLTGVWQAGRPTDQTPDVAYVYRVGEWAAGAGGPAMNTVTTLTLGPDGQQLASTVLLDGLLRTVQTQVQTGNPVVPFSASDPDGDGYANGVLITATRRDARGLPFSAQGPYFTSAPAVQARADGEPQLWAPVERIGDGVPRTSTTFDPAGRPVTSTSTWPTAPGDPTAPDAGPSAAAATTTWTYNGLTTTTDAPAGGVDSTVTTDPAGRQTTINQGSGADVRSVLLGWDALDRPTTATSAGMTWTRGYDQLGRILTSTDPDRGTTTSSYTATAAASAAVSTDAAGNTRTTLSDALGRTLSDRWASPDAARSIAATTSWDGLGLDSDGDGAADAPALGLPVHSSQQIDGGGLAGTFTTDLVYDTRYQPVRSLRTLPPDWQLGGAADSYPTGYTYRGNGALDRTALPGITGRAGSMVLPAEELVVGYDAFGRASTILGAGAHTSGTIYNARGLPALTGTEETPGAGTWTTNNYDGAARQTGTAWWTADAEGTITEQNSTTTAYDPAGNPTATTTRRADGTLERTCAQFDGLARLAAWWTPGTACSTSSPGDLDPADPQAQSTAWAFDPTTGAPATIDTTTATGASSTAITRGTGTHQLQTAATTGSSPVDRSFTWNPDGTPRTWSGPDGSAWTLASDPAGNTVSLTDGTNTIERAVTPDGTLLAEEATAPTGASTLTIPLGAAGTLTITTTALGTTTVTAQRDYPRPDGTVGGTRNGTAITDAFAYRTDPQGTPLQTAATTLLDGTEPAQPRRYTPYGQQRGPPDTTWPTDTGWLGKQQTQGIAATGLVRLGARDYDPSLATFTTTDPLTSFGNPWELDPYAYSGWNPLAYSDPSGLAKCSGKFRAQKLCNPTTGAKKYATPTGDDWRTIGNIAWQLLPIADAVDCARGSASACAWTAASLIPGGRLPRAAIKVANIAHDADKAADAARAAQKAADAAAEAAAHATGATRAVPAPPPVVGSLSPDGAVGLGSAASGATKLNRAGQAYPDVIDPRTGSSIHFPGEGLTKVPTSQRVTWGSKDRGAFIKEWYDRGYSTPEGGWSGYDIHHIRPREYGGTNDFDNLVPIPRDVHQEQFTSWWRNY